MVRAALVEVGATPFCANTAKVKTPAVVAIPDSSPVALSLIPGGRLPLARANSGAGSPVAANLNKY